MIIAGPAPISPYPKAWQEFGERLRAARLAIPMALRKFAAAIEQSPTVVSQVEQGDMRNALLVKTMCIKLGVDVREYEALENI